MYKLKRVAPFKEVCMENGNKRKPLASFVREDNFLSYHLCTDDTGNYVFVLGTTINGKYIVATNIPPEVLHNLVDEGYEIFESYKDKENLEEEEEDEDTTYPIIFNPSEEKIDKDFEGIVEGNTMSIDYIGEHTDLRFESYGKRDERRISAGWMKNNFPNIHLVNAPVAVVRYHINEDYDKPIKVKEKRINMQKYHSRYRRSFPLESLRHMHPTDRVSTIYTILYLLFEESGFNVFYQLQEVRPLLNDKEADFYTYSMRGAKVDSSLIHFISTSRMK